MSLKRKIAVALLLTVAAWMLAGHLAADGPIHLSTNPGLNFDPPSKCHNARNRILFGRWITDDWTPYLHSPIYNLAQAAVFRLTGIGPARIRLLDVAVSLVTLLLTFLVVRETLGWAAGLLAMMLTQFTCVFLIYGRSGLLEPLEEMFTMLTAWTLVRAYRHAEEDRPRLAARWMLLATLAAGYALFSKAWGITVLLALIVTVCVFPPRRRALIPLAVAGCALPVALYLGPFIHLNRHAFQLMEHEFRHKIIAHGGLIANWLHQPTFAFMPYAKWLIAAGLLALVVVLPAAGQPGRRKNIAPLAFIAFDFIILSQVLSFSHYRPERYWVPLVPLAAILATTATILIYRRLHNPPPSPSRWSPARTVGVWALTTYVLYLGPIHSKLNPWFKSEHLARIWELATAAVAATILLWVAVKSARRSYAMLLRTPLRLRITALTTAATLLAAAYLNINLKPWWKWHHHPHYTLAGFSRLLGRRYRDLTIAGESPLFTVVANRYRALKVTGYGLNLHTMPTAGVTHLITLEHHGYNRFYRRRFPRLMRHAVLLDRPDVCGQTFLFYALDLAPLEITAAPSADSSYDSPSLQIAIHNPDPHTPQSTLFLLFSNCGSGTPVFTAARRVEVLPLQKRRFTWHISPAAEKRPFALRLYALRDDIWLPAETSRINSRHTRIWDDALARGLLVRTFKRPGKHLRRPVAGYIAVPIPTNHSPLICGARLRGTLEPGDSIRYAWYHGGRLLRAIPVSRAGIPTADYAAVLIGSDPLPAPAEFRIEFKGRGELFVDGLLAASRAELLTNAFFRQSIAVPPPGEARNQDNHKQEAEDEIH